MMGLFEHWPYVNFHDMNLDWVIKKIKNVEISEANTLASAEAAAESAAASQLSANAALASQEAAHQSELNAAQSEENAAGSEASAKNYADHIADPVAGLVSDWLTDNISPTTPVIDSSLTVSGAGADAAVTGNLIRSNEEIINAAINHKKQLLDNDTKQTGKCYDLYQNAIVTNDISHTAIYSPVFLSGGQNYYYKNLYSYFCIFKSGNTYQRLETRTDNFRSGSFTPSEDGYLYVSVVDNVPGTVQALSDGEIKLYVTSDTKLYDVSEKADKYIHIAIKADGTGDYASPVAAVRDINDSAEDRQYVLDMYPGTYNMQNDYASSEQQGSIWGLTLPDYVHMKGIGNKEEIIVNVSMPSSAGATAIQNTSVVNLKYNNDLENITFTGNNVRYIVHDESSNSFKNYKRNVRNCRFVHNGNDSGFWAYTDAWGEGSSSGGYSYFENCIFENNSYVAPFSFHTNTDFENPCTHIFKNCQFIQNYAGSDTEGAFRIDDIQCRQPINIEFTGCYFSKYIFVINHQSSEDIQEINITGSGNSPVEVYSYRPNVQTPKKIYSKFSDEVMMVFNPYAQIDAGRPLRWTNYKNNTVGIEQNNGIECCGIALDAIPETGYGYMKYAGILNLYYYGITNLSSGKNIGVSSWTVAEVHDGSQFARTVQENVIKFL